MTLAAETRQTVEQYPFLVTALRADVVNYTGAARFLLAETALEGDRDAIATALRRYGEQLSPLEYTDRNARVTMHSGVTLGDGGDEDATPTTVDDETPLLTVGSVRLSADAGGSYTALLAAGSVDTTVLAGVLEACSLASIEVVAAGYAETTLVVVVDRLDGANALRLVERTLSQGRE